MSDSNPITRLNAALEGRYRIDSELGEGGMANVYLADDLKHERKVALKVLKPELAAVVGAERFLAEIKTTANLSHPHILPLFDSGEADGFLFYVMPHVEGESLRDRLEREHQLPVGDAVKIATNLAEALDNAHRKGVIHRDIKPANVLLLDGKPVISDFGIALAVGNAGQGRMTETGLSLGTPHYMSPEQATGDLSVGAATDIYALGCVLYEMLVGEPPYTGSTAQAILGKIIAGEVAAATKQRGSVPGNVDAAIRKALEKVPADRFASAREFATALADPGFRHGVEVVAATAGRGLWNPLSMMLGALALVLGLGLSWQLLRPEPPQPVERFAEDLGMIGRPGVSPDGSAVVFVGAAAAGGGQQLWLRRWEFLTPTPIAGTEGVSVRMPVISPTGDDVAFIVDGQQLKVAPLGGGGVRTLVETALCCTSHWAPDGFIYYSAQGVINRVSATDGAVEVVTVRDQESDGHLDFQVLPGGEVAVFSVSSSEVLRVEAMRLASGERKVLTPGRMPHVTPTGHLVFGTDAGQILAAPFDAENMELTGAAVLLAEGRAYSLSQSGTLVYLAEGVAQDEFVWVTRSGQTTLVDSGHTFPRSSNQGWRLSPDETRIAFNYPVDGNHDIRIKHLPDGPEERITFGAERDVRPFWTPDGQSVTYFSGTRDDDLNVWSRRADGTGEPVLVLDDQASFADGEWSLDGEWLVLRSAAADVSGNVDRRDILAFRPGVDSAAVPKVANPESAEGDPSFSADGRWLAYTSLETGSREVFVRPFPNVDSTRVRVSANGGVAPVWARSGSELFFVDANRGLVAAQFDPLSGRVREQETLFTIPPGHRVSGGWSWYDVSSDGERFLMARTSEKDASRYIVVQNWFEELKRLVPN